MERSRLKFIASLFGAAALSPAAKAQQQEQPPLTRSDVRNEIMSERSVVQWESRPFENGGRCPVCRADNRKWNEAATETEDGPPDASIMVDGLALRVCQHCGTVYLPQAKPE